MRNLLVSILASMAACALPSAQAIAGTFSISPVRVDLAAQSTTGVVTIRNQEEQPVVVQAETRLWQQTSAGEQLEPTRDVLVTPAVFTIPPQGSQVVRIALRRDVDPRTELSYRLILTEVPQQAAPGFNGLNMALRMSLPIFIAAQAPTAPQVKWSAARSPDGTVTVTALNAGSEHARVLDLMISPEPGNGEWLHQQGAHYVLPGQSHSWALESDKNNNSAQWRQLRVKGSTADGDFATELSLTSE
ncbi:MAG: fimbria/pilus periplasmic chaperone [Proteobacteria bacterium]|nr:fimbria/pilus periplasmic chaperone [Pseudomonadota bacterium]